MNRIKFVLLASLCVAVVLSSCASVKDIGLEGSEPVVQVSRLEAKAQPEVVELPIVTLEGDADAKSFVPFALRAGDVVTFGSYRGRDVKWVVLSSEDGRAVLVSQYLLPCDVVDRMYNDVNKDVSWEDCSLRRWLNDVLCGELFNEQERGVLASDGNGDLVSLLSVEEARDFLGSFAGASSLTASAGLAASYEGSSHGASVGSYANAPSSSAWWLRSTGSNPASAAYVDANGVVIESGMAVNYTFGIRPMVVVETGV